MLKLMKYEFRKLRTTLLILLGSAAALEVGFLAGQAMKKTTMMTVCLGLITFLTFLVYAYILLAGMASYSRELKEKSGYLIFMTPVTPLGVVISKLLFTTLAAVAATVLFGGIAYLDFRMLFERMHFDARLTQQINTLLRFGLKADAGIEQILGMAAFYTVTVLVEILSTMCTAYLAITLSATLLQNKKGFLRALISLVLFVALNWGLGWLTQNLVYSRVALDTPFQEMTGPLAVSVGMNAVFCALFAGASAWLLDKKVNL